MGSDYFIMDDSSTYVDPNPLLPNKQSTVHVGGRFRTPAVDLANVQVKAYMFGGSKFFDEIYPCNGDTSCPSVDSTFGSVWQAEFPFLSGTSDSDEQELHVIALDSNYNSIFEVRSTFYIQ